MSGIFRLHARHIVARVDSLLLDCYSLMIDLLLSAFMFLHMIVSLCF